VAVVDLGRDVEFGFIQIGPQLISSVDMDTHEKVEMKPSLTEVSRTRVSWPTCISLAMNIIEVGIKTDKLKGDAIASTISEWIVEFELTKESKDGN
jgi:hypothetical protein